MPFDACKHIVKRKFHFTTIIESHDPVQCTKSHVTVYGSHFNPISDKEKSFYLGLFSLYIMIAILYGEKHCPLRDSNPWPTGRQICLSFGQRLSPLGHPDSLDFDVNGIDQYLACRIHESRGTEAVIFKLAGLSFGKYRNLWRHFSMGSRERICTRLNFCNLYDLSHPENLFLCELRTGTWMEAWGLLQILLPVGHYVQREKPQVKAFFFVRNWG